MVAAARVADDAMRYWIDTIGNPGYGARRQTVGEEIRVRANIRKIICRSAARVQKVLLDHRVDLCPIVIAGALFRGITVGGNSGQDQSRQDPQNNDDREQLH